MHITRKNFLFREMILAFLIGAMWTGMFSPTQRENSAQPALPEDAVSFLQHRMKAVVQIQRIQNGVDSMGVNELEDFFLPENRQVQQGIYSDERTLGTGFIVREDGYVVTTNALLLNLREVHVILHDGSRFPARIVGNDLLNHVALLKIEADRLPFIALNEQERIRGGQLVFAIGSPMDAAFHNSVSVGVVSAKRVADTAWDGIEYWLTDATLSPGNSGGPLFDVEGHFLGMAHVPMYGSNMPAGLSSVLTRRHLALVTGKLIDNAEGTRMRLGIHFTPAADEMEQGQNSGSARVIAVDPGSSAEEAGVLLGDIILKVNGSPLTNYMDLSRMIEGKQYGDVITLTIQRATDALNLQIRLMSRRQQLVVGEEDPKGKSQLGFAISNVSDELMRDLEIPVQEGVLILYVDPSSAAYREGDIRSGMILTSLAGQSVRTEAEFFQVLDTLPQHEAHVVELYRPQASASFLSAIVIP